MNEGPRKQKKTLIIRHRGEEKPKAGAPKQECSISPVILHIKSHLAEEEVLLWGSARTPSFPLFSSRRLRVSKVVRFRWRPTCASWTSPRGMWSPLTLTPSRLVPSPNLFFLFLIHFSRLDPSPLSPSFRVSFSPVRVPHPKFSSLSSSLLPSFLPIRFIPHPHFSFLLLLFPFLPSLFPPSSSSTTASPLETTMAAPKIPSAPSRGTQRTYPNLRSVRVFFLHELKFFKFLYKLLSSWPQRRVDDGCR